MSTYIQSIYHIVYSTKHRDPCLAGPNRVHLYKYIWGTLNNKKCHLYRIGGVEDHIHILTHLHPTIALSALIKDIKMASNGFIKKQKLFPHFRGWQEGYGAFSCSFDQKNQLIEYVKAQEEHHKKVSFRDEFIALLNENGIDFEEKYLL